jgi:hypothetical protein
MKVLFILLFVQAFIIFDAKTQSITPFTLNIAGFSSIQNGYALTISTGETVSIVDFKAPNGLGLSSGFLQIYGFDYLYLFSRSISAITSLKTILFLM